MCIKRLQFVVIGLLFSLCCFAEKQPVGNWNTIPLAQSIEPLKEKNFVLNGKTTIYCPDNANELQKRNVEFLISYIEEVTGMKLKENSKMANNQIRLSLNSSIKGNEAYEIKSTSKVLMLSGSTPAGVFYGLQTLTKALPIAKNVKQVELPSVMISDSPRFVYRAFLIDVGRHFFSIEYLKKLIDMFALHHINYFHWHLTEDQGWRIEIKKYPKLTEIGSKRTETVLPGDKEYDGTPVSGYYTQEEARELVKYAADRFITIIPEIDMPGHIQSALAAYPELGCTGGPYPVCTHFGVIKEVLCAGNPKALQLAKDVVNEIMDIFPSEYIHLGGDECPKDRWKECAKCQQKIKDLNLKDEDKHSKEELLQTWFMGELEKDIRARGRKMIAWDEILDGSPSKTVTVIGWTSKDASIRSARQGYPTVVAPITNFYFSNPRINKIEGIPSIQRVYDLDPCFDVLTPEEQKNIIGAEGCIWTEWVKDSTKLEWQLLPRLAALCEVQWTPKDKRNLDNFLSRMFHMQELYQLKKMNYRKDIGEDVLKSKESKGFFCK
jgi:beta-L-N-acetylhexosaminidase